MRLTEQRVGPTLTLTAAAMLLGHPVTRGLDYQLWVQRTTGRWILADRFGPAHTWQVPPNARAAYAAVLPTALVTRHAWGLAVKSPTIAVTYPSLPAWVAHQPQAPLSLVKKDLYDPAKLGLLNMSGKDQLYVLHTLGNPKAPAKLHALEADMALYAMLADNASIYGGPLDGWLYRADWPWYGQGGSPTNIASVNTIVQYGYKGVSNGYLYRVFYTQTNGVLASQGEGINIGPITSNGSGPWAIQDAGQANLQAILK